MPNFAATPRNPRPRTAGVRQSESGAFNPYANGRYSVIPRRALNSAVTSNSNGIYGLCYSSPLRLLSILPDIHPTIGLALWNALRLACAPGDLRIVAMTTDGGDEQVDDKGNQALDALWGSLPSEIGGLNGLQRQLFQQAILTGLICAEAVPGRRGKGVGEIWPVDSLSIGFNRNPETQRIIPLQRQMFPTGETKLGWTELDPNTFFWSAMDAMVDEPYGRAPYAPAVAECLADLAMMQDLRDAVHNAAWPRLSQGFNFTESYKVATEIMNLREPEASEWVNTRFQEVVVQSSSLKADDNIFYDSAAGVGVIEGGQAFRALEPILTYLRQRIVQSVKSLPTLMGINDGSTQTYTTVEWKIYATGLEDIRDITNAVIVKIANLHLQLLGLPLKAVAKVTKIRTEDALIEAQAEALRIQNGKELVRMGFKDPEELSIELTGSKPFNSDPKPGAFGEVVAPPVATPPEDPPADSTAT